MLDGELVILGGSFDKLQLRLHPAASRIAKLSREDPATFIAFDLLADDCRTVAAGSAVCRTADRAGRSVQSPGRSSRCAVSKNTHSPVEARRWLKQVGLDGIVAKRLDLPYRPGRRDMLKFKLWHTVDCVVGGVYYKPGTQHVEYLLCGVYHAAGRLDYVGRCGVDDPAIDEKVRPLVGGEGFTGDARAVPAAGRGGNAWQPRWSRNW